MLRNNKMAAYSEHELSADGDISNEAINVSDWTNGQDSDSHQKRSDIISIITSDCRSPGNDSLDNLRTIVQSGWDVNEMLNIHVFNKGVHSTALHGAVRQGWTEGVKVLLDAGAKCWTSDRQKNPLTLALLSSECSPDFIELLLKHGADPNDHDDSFDNIPLLCAIQNVLHNPYFKIDVHYCSYNQNAIMIVKLLLEHGADPNVTVGRNNVRNCFPLSGILDVEFGLFAALFKMLVHFGADVNYSVNGTFPLLHRMLLYAGQELQDKLDLYFQHGGNINIEDGNNWTALGFALRQCAHSNIVRWLIRHGANTSPMKATWLRSNVKLVHNNKGYSHLDTPLMLMQAGMRLSHGAHILFSDLSTVLQRDVTGECLYDRSRAINEMWYQLEKAEREELETIQSNSNKSTFPAYWPRQMVDLQEFSDESLQLYPEVYSSGILTQKDILEQIHRVLEFLRQTQSLQWYCRCCVRENLVSLQPSVVNTLHIPATLKRYVLCHEL